MNYHFVNELKLPKLPEELEHYCFQTIESTSSMVTDYRTSFFNIYPVVAPLQSWLSEHVMEFPWIVQTFTGDCEMHVDRTSTTNLLYFLDMGGEDVITTFYHEDDQSVLERVKLEPRKWYTFKADILHGVENIEPGRSRIALCAAVFKRMPVQRRQSALFLNEKFQK